MTRLALQSVLRHFKKVLAGHEDTAISDSDLLERFLAARDETAFELLVWRHHRLVLGVCSRILADSNDVEDAFQATFLILACKPWAIRQRGSLASWLYGVARRVALQASRGSRRLLPANLPVASPCPEPSDELIHQELQQAFDEELGRLPEKYRTAIVLCYLEGRTYEEAGRQLGWPKGTVSTRLARARELLHQRLAGRGIALSAGAMAGWLCAQAASAAAPASLLTATARAGALVAAGRAGMGVAGRAQVSSLVKVVMQGMFMTRVKYAALAAMVLTLIAIGMVGFIYQSPAQGDPPRSAAAGGEQGKNGQRAVQPADLERLQGGWKVAQEKFGGEEMPPERRSLLQLVFAKDKVEYLTDTYLLEGTFKLGSQAVLKELDITIEGRVMRAIYRLDGEKLLLAVSSPYFETERPKDFNSTQDDRSKSVLTLERVAGKADQAVADDVAAKQAKLKAARLQCGGSLFRLMQAMHRYLDEHNRFPFAATTDGSGKPLLSWRVALLPYLGEKELYQQFHQDEPWDSEHNRKLLPKMPKIYASVGNPPKTEHGTYCQVFVGEGCLFEMGKEIGINDVADGTVCTLAMITAGEAVPWTKPEDLVYGADKPLPSLAGGMIDDGLTSVATADGCVHVTTNTVDEQLFRALLTRSGGEIIDIGSLKK